MALSDPNRSFKVTVYSLNANISQTGHTIDSMFGSRHGFSGLADRMALHVFSFGPNSIGM